MVIKLFNVFNKEYPLAPSEPIGIGQDDINPFEVEGTPITKTYKYSIKKQGVFILKGKIHSSVGIWIEPIFDKGYFELNCKGYSNPNCECGGDDFIKHSYFRLARKDVLRLSLSTISEA